MNIFDRSITGPRPLQLLSKIPGRTKNSKFTNRETIRSNPDHTSGSKQRNKYVSLLKKPIGIWSSVQRASQRHSLRVSATTEYGDEAKPGKTRVGFIGLGILGYPMTQNLVKAGYDVTVWNRTTSKSEQLAAESGGKVLVAKTPGEVMEKSDVVVSVLVDGRCYDAIAHGDDGILAHLKPGQGFVDVSTVDPETSQRISHDIKARGGLYLAAPVSGSKGPAETGTLIFITAGDEELNTLAAPLLDVMGKMTVFLGDLCSAAKMKIVVNMIMGNMMVAFAEGMNLAEASGLRKEDLLAILSNGAMACPMFALKGEAMSNGSYPTAFPLKHQLKDLKFAVELASETNAHAPNAALSAELYETARDAGYGDEDFSAVQKVI